MIELKGIQPIPLKEMVNGIGSNSNIFGTELSLERGKNYLVLAPSGKGKSTFLHIIYGLRNDFTGNLVINGEASEALKSDKWSDLRKLNLSIVFQDLRLFPDLTAFENIQLKNKLTDHKTEADIRGMAKHLGVEELLEKNVASLSYGQRQRMAIIRALCQPFEFLLLDEPFSHLDAENTALAIELIKKECEAQGAGVILVSLGEEFDFSFHEKLIL